MPRTFVCGMDIGKQQDPAAFVITEQFLEPHPERPHEKQTVYEVAAIKRWDLQTEYMHLGDEVCRIVTRPPLHFPTVGFDASGPGGDAFDEIIRSCEPLCELRPVAIVGGENVTERPGTNVRRVGKVRMIGAMLSLFASNRIRLLDPNEEPMPLLMRQVRLLQVKITKAMNETIDTPRDASGHCDVAMALAIAVWVGENTVIGWDGTLGMPQTQGEGKSILTQARGVFATDPNMSAWTDPNHHQPRGYFDREGNQLPPDRDGPNRQAYVPPWGPDW